MLKTIKAATALFLLIILLIPSACADLINSVQRICLVCGSPADTTECLACGSPKECWICNDCLTKNMSDACMNCGKTRQDSLAAQAADPRAMSAWPAVSYLAAEGDPVNLLRLGTYYQRGIVVEKDIDQALTLFRKAGEAGYAPAWLYLGKMYDGGIDVAVDLASALDYYQIAADKGDADSLMSLASFYLQGLGVEEDHDKALQLYREAAEAGSHLACDYLGYLYMTGTYVEKKDRRRAELVPQSRHARKRPQHVRPGLCLSVRPGGGNGPEGSLEVV